MSSCGEQAAGRWVPVRGPCVGWLLAGHRAASADDRGLERWSRHWFVLVRKPGPGALGKSLQVLKPGGKIISIAGPPDPAFARELGANPLVRLAITALSFRIRQRARRRRVTYSFLFVKASGDQLRQVTALIEAGTIRPVVDRVFPFESTPQALAYVEEGRAKAGKVVIRMK